MKRMRRLTAFLLAAALIMPLCCTDAFAKTNPGGQTVGTVLFYVKNSAGEDVLVSHVTAAEMEADLKAGKIDTANHNYSLLDRYITTVHQEAQGFTVPEFISYAQSKSEAETVRNVSLAFAGQDKVAFWEIDQKGFEEKDTYTYENLYGVKRYNFPALYEYWDYRAQDYYDPAGLLTKEQVVDRIFRSGEEEVFLLAVRAYSQRYMATDDKYGTGDYAMEDLWKNSGLMDTERAIRLMKPMTEEELRNRKASASDTRYWVSNILLDMNKDPAVTSLGKTAAPKAVMTEDADNYYITFDCETSGATVLYNHNYLNPSYAPSAEYTGGDVIIPKSFFPDGTVTMTCRAVKDGYTDAGVITLALKSSGSHTSWKNPYTDVGNGSWYYSYVKYVTENGLFDAAGKGAFAPEAPMTRAMLATALYRLAGSPDPGEKAPFTDVSANAAYADAVTWAYNAGVVNGKTQFSFAPDASITREQITAMFWRYANNTAKADMTPDNNLKAYTDAGKLSAYAVDCMRWAVGAGLINGTSNTLLTPQGTATRAQVAAMVERIANYVKW